jgi:hypothetical protein
MLETFRTIHLFFCYGPANGKHMRFLNLILHIALVPCVDFALKIL